MGDDEEPPAFFLFFANRGGNDLNRIHVPAGIDFIEQSDARLKQLELKDFVAFLLAAGKAFVEIAGGHFKGDAHFLIGSLHLRIELEEGHGFLPSSVQGGLEEVRGVDAGDFGGILHCEEQAELGTLVDG